MRRVGDGRCLSYAVAVVLVASGFLVAEPLDVPAAVLAAEARRIETIERVSPSVVCVLDENLRGGGSGVLIDEDGYGLTNYHVVAGLLRTRKGWGGLGDGILYEMEVLGIDITGDVAMFRLIPPKEPYRFPFARLGNSDAVRVGDTAIAMGNPFILAEDYSPSVSLGLVTGVHRYQWGVEGNLAYTDCIQVDTAINPGNSGGPLFSDAGEVIGINGRISVSTRGRFNVGFGYAISANQIRRFMPALRAGLLALHGTWQARVEEVDGSGVVFSEIREPGPAYDAGVRRGDTLITLDGVTIQSANQVASLLGTYPTGWPLPLSIERLGAPLNLVVRLDPVQPKMKHPFLASQDINARQVVRVLQGFRDGTRGTSAALLPTRWRWTVTRAPEAKDKEAVRPSVRFEAGWEFGGPVTWRQRFDDGTVGRIIEFDAARATQRADTNADAFDLLPAEALALRSLFVLHEWASTPVDKLDIEQVAHIGSDALVGPTGTSNADGSPRLLEVIQWPIGEQAVAMYSLDADTFAVRRIVVHDDVAGTQTEITLSDYKDVGGVVWPQTMRIDGPERYTETLSNWELSP